MNTPLRLEFVLGLADLQSCTACPVYGQTPAAEYWIESVACSHSAHFDMLPIREQGDVLQNNAAGNCNIGWISG